MAKRASPSLEDGTIEAGCPPSSNWQHSLTLSQWRSRGKRMTSRMDLLPVRVMMRRSMPMPSPALCPNHPRLVPNPTFGPCGVSGYSRRGWRNSPTMHPESKDKRARNEPAAHFGRSAQGNPPNMNDNRHFLRKAFACAVEVTSIIRGKSTISRTNASS